MDLVLGDLFAKCEHCSGSGRIENPELNLNRGDISVSSVFG